MIIKKSNISLWSNIGSRATFGLSCFELGKSVDNLIVLTCDTSTSAGLDRFKNTFPEKFLEIGIAEQNMIGIAAGLSSEGFKIITTTFAPFETLRCCEQIKVNLGYMKHNICMVGLASGVVLGTLGYSHCCIEDIGIMRSIPNISIVSPADCTETFKATQAAIHHNESIYIRLTGASKNNPVYNEDYKFEIGKAITLKEGNDIAIIANGTMVYESLLVANNLLKMNISTAVINMHTVKPLDTKILKRLCKTKSLIVTIEEHSVVGGLGTAIAEYISKIKNSPPQLFLGLPHEYNAGNDYNNLLIDAGLTSKILTRKIKNEYKKLI